MPAGVLVPGNLESLATAVEVKNNVFRLPSRFCSPSFVKRLQGGYFSGKLHKSCPRRKIPLPLPLHDGGLCHVQAVTHDTPSIFRPKGKI